MLRIVVNLSCVALVLCAISCGRDDAPVAEAPTDTGNEAPSTVTLDPPKDIFEAATRDDVAFIESVLSDGADVNAFNTVGETALHVAAREGHAESAGLLLTHGANPNAEANGDFGPLVYAAMNGHTDVCALLIDGGAIVDPARDDLMSPMECAKDGLHRDTVLLLRQRGAAEPPVTCLYDAIENWDAVVAAQFLSDGASAVEPDAYDSPDRPIHHVASLGYVDIAKLLVAHGANVNARPADQPYVSHGNHTPLHIAAFREHLTMVQFLLEHGAKINALDASGETPLDCVPRYSNACPTERLLRKEGGRCAKELEHND